MSAILHIKFEPCFIEKILQLRDYDDQIKKLLEEIKCEEEEDERIMCDYVISLLNHLLECGTTFPHMATTLNFSLEFMKNTCNSSLVNALRTLQQTLPGLNSINQYQTKCVLEFINKTYFQHFNLYKYILTLPRQQDYTRLDKDVYVVEEPNSLSGGVEEHQWRYDEKMKLISQQHAAAMAEAEMESRSRPVERLDKRGRVHQDNVNDLVTCYIRNHFENIENEVKRSLKITEIAMEKELAVIEAGIARNKEKEEGSTNSTTPPKKPKSPKSAQKSASRKKSPGKK